MNRIDVFCWLLIVIWLGGSGYCAAVGNADLFQRLGAMGIAVAVLYFVLQEHGTPAPPGLHEANAITQKQILHLSNGVQVASANNAMLAKAIAAQDHASGKPQNPVIVSLASVQIETIREAFEWDPQALEQKLDSVAVQQKNADAWVSRTLRSSEVSQAVVVILGTLQSGFGDLIIEQVCSRSLAC